MWRGLAIPLPPNAQWQELGTADIAAAPAPVVARGAVTYAATAAPVERPYGPIVTLYTFPDSLDAWIELQQQDAAAVDASTIQDTRLASPPAKRYQPVVIGLCNRGVYIAKIAATQLIEVTTDCLDEEPYSTIIAQLRLATP